MSTDFSKLYYRIGDVAELLGLPQSTIRYWEKEFGSLRPRRNTGGTRYFSPNDIELLRLIKFLLYDKGLTIEGAREHLRHNRDDVEKKHQVIRRLQVIRRRLVSMLDTFDKRAH